MDQQDRERFTRLCNELIEIEEAIDNIQYIAGRCLEGDPEIEIAIGCREPIEGNEKCVVTGDGSIKFMHFHDDPDEPVSERWAANEITRRYLEEGSGRKIKRDERPKETLASSMIMPSIALPIMDSLNVALQARKSYLQDEINKMTNNRTKGLLGK